ncbi:MAG: zinc ABC transporter substrate-binding protein [Pseudomonadota bacterium]
MTLGIRRRRRRVRPWWAIFALVVHFPVGAAPNVVVSIAPLHSLVSAILEGVAEPALLMRGQQSPHTHRLRPSQVRAIYGADLVFWIGPGLESGLARYLRERPPREAISLAAIPEVRLLQARRGGLWPDTEGPDLDVSNRGVANQPNIDPHLWLDPQNAIVWAQAIAARLIAIDPNNRDRYEANLGALQNELWQTESQVINALKAADHQTFLVIHDSYQYFEKRFGIPAAGALLVGDQHQPGARRVGMLRAQLEQSGAACIAFQPQFSERLVETIAEGFTVNTARVDPLGSHLEPGRQFYAELLTDIAKRLAQCLTSE